MGDSGLRSLIELIRSRFSGSEYTRNWPFYESVIIKDENLWTAGTINST